MLNIPGYKDELIKVVVDNKTLFEKLGGKTVIVTGGAGLIGSYLLDCLLISNELFGTKIKIICFDKSSSLLKKRFSCVNSEYLIIHNVDINTDVLTDYSADYLIHAASNTSPADYAARPVSTIQTNVVGTDRLLSYCVKNNIPHFLFCSSVEAYGKAADGISSFSETDSGYVDSNTLRAAYPSAKRAAEALCNAYIREYPQLSFSIVRIGRIFGPTVIPGDAKAPSQFITNAADGENIILKSDGKQIYSWGYVADCVTAMLYVLLYGKNAEAYNIASYAHHLYEFAECAAKAGGTALRYEEQSQAEKAGYSKITMAVMNIEKIRSLGWQPSFAFDEAIANTVNYLKHNKHNC